MRWPNARPTTRGSDLRSAMRRLHYLTGLLIFVLTWLRFILRTQADWQTPALAGFPSHFRPVSPAHSEVLLLYAGCRVWRIATAEAGHAPWNSADATNACAASLRGNWAKPKRGK